MKTTQATLQFFSHQSRFRTQAHNQLNILQLTNVAVPCRNQRFFGSRIAKLSSRVGLICALQIHYIHASTKHAWAPPLTEVQRYGASNTAMWSKYMTGFLHGTATNMCVLHCEFNCIWNPLATEVGDYILLWAVFRFSRTSQKWENSEFSRI